MANVRGCNLPEDVYYLIDKHVWAKPLGGGVVRVGMTSIAAKLAGGKFTAVTGRAKNIGQEIKQGKSMATVESSKFVGPVPAPVSGILIRINEKLATDPNLVVSDPYVEGWIAEIQAAQWDVELAGLPTGEAAVKAYQAKLEAENIICA